MKHKIAVFVTIAIVVAFSGYSLFSVLGPSHTLAQSGYLTRGVAYEQLKFTNGAMSSTYNLSAGASDGPIGSSSVFAVTLSIKKTGQDMSGPYTNSSF